MKIAVVTASFGSSQIVKNFPIISNMNIIYYHFTDDNFSRRKNSLHPRLQSKIPKMFGWQLIPNQDFYIWMDDSFIINDKTIEWLYFELGNKDIVLFKHPYRNTVEEEAQFLKDKQNNAYIRARYEGEDIDGLLEEIQYKTNSLYASGLFLYRNNKKMQEMMKDWWYYTSRYHQCCQLSLPYVLMKHNINVSIIGKNIYKNQYAEFIGHK